MKGVLLLCGRLADEPRPCVAGRVGQCDQCRIEVWVADSGLRSVEPSAEALGMGVRIVCLSCGEYLLREAESEGHENMQVARTPDQLRDSFYRRMNGNR